MCSQDCTCVGCVAAFGQQLAGLLQIWSDMTCGNSGEQVGHDIEACTNTLRQLKTFLDQEKASNAQIFTFAGHQDIEALTIKCNLIFKAIILIIQKATENNVPDSTYSNDDADRNTSVLSGKIFNPKPGKKRIFDEEANKAGNDKSPEEKSDLLVGVVPDLTSTKTMGLIGKLRGRKCWLGNRIEPCEVQLRWIRKSLLLYVQMGRLTCLANQTSGDSNGSFESQMILRSSVILLWRSQLQHVKKSARNQERAEKRAQRRLEAQKETDTDSIHSSSSRGTNSTVVAEETPSNNPPSDKLSTPADLCPSRTSTPGPLNPAGQPDSQVPTKANVAEVSKEQASSKLSTSLNGLGLKISGGMSEWAQKLFGKDDEFSKDWESQELEAWVFKTNSPYSNPMKVPFGHQRLKYGLKQSRSKKNDERGRTPFARYINGGPDTHTFIDEVVQEANRFQNRQRMFLSFNEYRMVGGGETYIIVFFSILEEKAPILFHDCVGRKMTLPFEICRTRESMNILIVEAFRNIPEIGPHVCEGHYNLEDAKTGEHILPELWGITINPGASINMKMWPNFETHHPLRNIYPSPPFGPPPRASSDMAARRDRISRMQAICSTPAGFHPPMPRPPMPMGLPHPPMPRPPMPMGLPHPPPPAFPPYGARFPPGMVRVNGGRPMPIRCRRAPSVSTIDEDEMTAAEEKELTFVNFVQERERMKKMTVTGILAKYTQLQDVGGQECIDEWSVEGASSGSSSDSDYSGSSGSESIVD